MKKIDEIYHSAIRRTWIMLAVGLILLTLPGLACTGSDEEMPTPAKATRTSKPAPTQKVGLTGEPEPVSDQEAEWLVLLYMDADDGTLEKDIFTDLNEAERVGSTDKMRIVAQIDRYKGGYKGDGNWTGARRYYLTQDPDLKKLKSEMVADLGEVNMADGNTLVDFITWGVKQYPAKKVALILSDHGMGWPGGFFDPAPGGNGKDKLALAEDYGDGIWLMELDKALGKAREQTGLEKFDLVGFDACLMAGVEVFSAMSKHSRTMVASEELEPGLGWAYSSFLIDLAFDTQKDGKALAQSIVNSYIDKDVFITDDKARGEFAEETFETREKSLSAEEVAGAMRVDVTLTAADLEAMPGLVKAVDGMALAIAEVDQNDIARVRAYTQAFQSPFDEDKPSPYIDLGHFASMLIEEDLGKDITSAARQVLKELKKVIIMEKHGEERPGASGISLYFPVSDLYLYEDNYDYKDVASYFVKNSQWDEYLDFYFTNVPPVEEAWKESDLWKAGSDTGKNKLKRVGAELLTMDPIKLSGDIATAENPVTMDTVVHGTQRAYLYVFMGKVNDDGTVLMVDDIDYLDAEKTRTVEGVVFPDWGNEKDLELSYDFNPVAYAISDGEVKVQALLMPEEYTDDSAVYSAEGYYHFAGEEGEPVYANLYFKDGELTEVYGYIGKDNSGAMHEITPQKGDSFTVLRQGINLEDDAAEDDVYEEGDTLTFGETNFTWEEIPAPAGIYVVGFIAEDYDGEQYAEFEVVEVQ